MTIHDERRAGRLAARFAESAAKRGQSRPTIIRSSAPTAPLSYEQQRLWHASGSAVAYNSAMRVDLDGPLDADRLAEALRAVADRQAILRASFHEGPDGPYQQVHDDASPRLEVLDADPAAVDEDLARRVREPFDLECPSPLRAVLWRTGPSSCVLLIVIHHLATDGWFRVLFDDLAAAYAGLPLAPLPVQYADYARWQRSGFAEGLFDAPIRELAAGLAAPSPSSCPVTVSGTTATLGERFP